MVGRPPPISYASHPDLLVLAQPGRTLVRATDRQETTPRRPPINSGPGERHSRLDHPLERKPPTLCLDQDRRRNPRKTQLISSTNSWRRTIGARCGIDANALWLESTRLHILIAVEILEAPKEVDGKVNQTYV